MLIVHRCFDNVAIVSFSICIVSVLHGNAYITIKRVITLRFGQPVAGGRPAVVRGLCGGSAGVRAAGRGWPWVHAAIDSCSRIDRNTPLCCRGAACLPSTLRVQPTITWAASRCHYTCTLRTGVENTSLGTLTNLICASFGLALVLKSGDELTCLHRHVGVGQSMYGTTTEYNREHMLIIEFCK